MLKTKKETLLKLTLETQIWKLNEMIQLEENLLELDIIVQTLGQKQKLDTGLVSNGDQEQKCKEAIKIFQKKNLMQKVFGKILGIRKKEWAKTIGQQNLEIKIAQLQKLLKQLKA